MPAQVLSSRFRLLESCASGGHTRWRAEELTTGEEVELVWGDSEEPPASALNAAAASLRVQHPVLATSRGLFRHEGFWVEANEAPLDGILGVGLGKPASERRVLTLGEQLADALVALHRAGLVHGDVHSGAVSLQEGRVRLGGLRGPCADPPLRAGQTAPELIAGAQASAAGDLYGLGVVLHTYASGALPYGEDAWAAVARQQSGQRGSLSVSDSLCALIDALLHPDPGARPTAIEAHHALRRLRRSLPAVSRSVPWPAVRPWASHAVVGHDPELGREVRVRTSCSRGEARRLVKQLQAAGWKVRSERVALGGRDFFGALFVGGLGHTVVPILGFAAGALWWLYQRSCTLRAREVAALPALSRRLPRAHDTSRRSGLVAAGVALMLAGPILLFLPWLSAVLVCVAALIVHAEQGGAARHPASALRVELVLEDLERIADTLEDPEASLSLLGEVQALRSEWRRDGGNAASVLHGAERLSRQHGTATAAASSRRWSSGEALDPHR